MGIGSLKPKVLLIFIITVLVNNYAQTAGPWELGQLYITPKWETTEKANVKGMTGILYESLPYKGKRVQVFAYYSAPEGEMPKGGWPAVVCVHGGGGTAFDKWVKIWNEHGYAAISMDLEGHYPIKDSINGEWQRIPTENPGCERVGTFLDFELSVQDQWYYNAVAHVVLAHTLICSFPEVNANKTGITGISWGGILTSTIMGVDKRFKFAIPIYGCGFIPNSDGYQGQNIKPGKHTETVLKYYDGSAYFKNVLIPTFWINGTNDKHFPMASTQKSLQSVKGRVTIRYTKEMIHSHKAGWEIEEIYAFANSIVKGSEPLLNLNKTKVQKGTFSVSVSKPDKVEQVQLLYTTDSGIWNQRQWQATAAQLKKSKIKATIPDHATTVFMQVTDERGLMVTSDYVEIK